MSIGQSLRRALVLALAVSAAWTAGVGVGWRGATAPGRAERPTIVSAVAAVSWPPSTGLLIGEVVTRAAAASDQYVELYNAAPVAISLADLELVYVTASGATVTRKQVWSDLALGAGKRLLLANSAGAFALRADGQFSGGLSTAGGSLVVRTLGGTVIDALGWGTATNAFVEGTVAAAPPTGSSLERAPGADFGNAHDTNDNLADSFINPVPHADGLAEPSVPPTPSPSATPTAPPPPTLGPSSSDFPYEGQPTFTDEWPPDATPTLATPTSMPTATEQPTATATSTPAPSPTPTPAPTILPTPSASPSPTTSPAPVATPTVAPTGAPSATTDGASPTATVTPLTIDQVRGQPMGASVQLRGVLSTDPGLTESGKGGFVQDETAGIALYLPSGAWPAVNAGDVVVARGVLESRFSLLTVRLETAADLTVEAAGEPPVARAVEIGVVGEAIEGLLVVLEGTISEGSSPLSDGFSTTINDATGSVRVVVATSSAIDPSMLSRGQRVRLTGVVGQRDSSGTGSGGYRVHPRWPTDIVQLPAATPTPASGSGPTATPARTATPLPTFATPSPTTAPLAISIGAALRRPGEVVTVEGIVTAAASLLDADSRRLPIQDATGAILLRLPLGFTPPAVGQRVRASGEVGTYYGAPQLAAEEAQRLLGQATVAVNEVSRAPLAPDLEWRLVRVEGVIESISRSGDAWRAELRVSGGSVPIIGLARSGIAAETMQAGRSATISGLVRRAYPTAVDQRFAVVPRSAVDIRLGAAVAPSPSAGAGSSTQSGEPAATAFSSAGGQKLADLAGREGQSVRIGGRVVGIDLPLVSIVDDSGGATLLLRGSALAAGAALRPGDIVNAIGSIGRDPRGAIVVVVASAGDLLIASRATASGASPAAASTPLDGGPPSGRADLPAESAGGPAAEAVLAGVLGVLALLGLVTGSAGVVLIVREKPSDAGLRRSIGALKAEIRRRLKRDRP